MTIQRLQLDSQIDWIPMSLAASLLGIHPSQVRRDRAVLQELDLIDYTSHSGGFTRKTLESLWIFRQLVSQRGRTEAIKQISHYLEP
ncbi:MAG: hypothetical protein V7K27_35635 [Nostoc sp.]|uniref:hypothetical protein n=1 Tax=Nostoc sp. TaxID=1180 RepID=UPI002FFA6EB7